MQWVTTGISELAHIISSLHKFMEIVYEEAGKRSKRAVSAIFVDSIGWRQNELCAFKSCKNVMVSTVTLAHRVEGQCICIYTDASDICWLGNVTQVPFKDLSLSHKKQRHGSLALCSGRFEANQFGWSTLKKKEYALMATVERMYCLAATVADFDLDTDHNNLIFLFDPLSLAHDVFQSSTRESLHWAVHLRVYSLTCLQIIGLDSVWADLVTRRSAPKAIRQLIKIPALPKTNTETFDWPSPTELVEVQKEHITSQPSRTFYSNGLWK